MKKHAAAAASACTLVALISTAESFISTPGSSTGNGRGDGVASTTTSAVGRAPPGCKSSSRVVCIRVGGVRRRRGTEVLRAQAKGGGAPGAGAAATEKREQQALSSAESAIDGKRQGEVEELKKKLQREHAVSRVPVSLKALWKHDTILYFVHVS